MLEQTALVLGASGGFGAAMAHELLRRGFGLRILARDPGRLPRQTGAIDAAEVVAGDALDPGAVARAAEGCGIIVHAVNYPFHQWIPNMERVTTNVIAAAGRAGAVILFPGNVYGFGPQTGGPLPEQAPMRPCSRKGRLRLRLERSLRSATADAGVRVVVLRAGDYYGPTVRNGLVDRIFAPAVRGRSMQVLGRLDVPHQWAYVPDLARLGVDLLEIRERLQPFETVHFNGHVVDSNRSFLREVARAAGHPDLPARATPWWLVRLLGVFNPQLRELLEMRYLWDEAVIMDDPRRRELLPDSVSTSLEEAVRITVESYEDSAPMR